jgi:FixJ family two-component response regulator
MSDKGALVYVVDDDSSAREGLARLIRSAGLLTKTFASGEEFLAAPRPSVPSCLVLDLNLPGINGLDLQLELGKSGSHLSIVFITGNECDDRTRSDAASDWTVAYFRKPFGGDELLEAVHTALTWKPAT